MYKTLTALVVLLMYRAELKEDDTIDGYDFCTEEEEETDVDSNQRRLGTLQTTSR